MKVLPRLESGHTDGFVQDYGNSVAIALEMYTIAMHKAIEIHASPHDLSIELHRVSLYANCMTEYSLFRKCVK